MNRIHRPFAASIRCAAALVTGVAAAAVALAGATPTSATAVLSVDAAFTDNYKASYNADPAQPELRTWLGSRSVTAGGVVYRPSSLPASGTVFVAAETGLTLRGADGSSAVLTASTSSTNALGQGFFRTDANGDFGLLMQERSRTALRSAPIHEQLSLVHGGVVAAAGSADYTYDGAVAGAAANSIEYNGPGGRWVVNGTVTRLDWEKSAPQPQPQPGTDTTAPVLAGVSLPANTASRTITITVNATDNVAVTQVRFANEDGVWSTWRTFAPSIGWTLSSAAAAYKGVTTQVRDARGNESAALYRRVTCSAPCS